jgi:hypothetical protein
MRVRYCAALSVIKDWFYLPIWGDLVFQAASGASKVWTYPDASSLGSDARHRGHSTVKPTAMFEDALLN